MQKLFLVAFFSIILLFSVVALSDASALKGKGTHNQKFGSKTKSVICGDVLCSEVKRDGKANPQSKFAMGGVSQQGVQSRGSVKQQEALPPTDTACDDGDPNTTGDVMVGETCVGTPTPTVQPPTDTACDDGDPNTTGDVMVGVRCSGNLLPDGTACDDGDPNTTGDVMVGGLCKGTPQTNQPTPAIPSILTGLEVIDVTSTSIKIIWTASGDLQTAADPIRYAIANSASPTGPFTNIGTTYGPAFTDTNLSPGKTYYYQISALNSIGQSQPSVISATTIVLSTPTSLTATALSTTSLKISWTAAGDVERYTIVRSTSQSGSFSYAGSSNTPSFTDTNLSPGATYYYQVSASTVNGPSEMSAIISGTTQVNPTKTPTQQDPARAGAPTDSSKTQCQPGYHYDATGRCVQDSANSNPTKAPTTDPTKTPTQQDPARAGAPANPILPTLSIRDASVNEGNIDDRSTTVTFTIDLSAPSQTPITFMYETTPGTATTPSDFHSFPYPAKFTINPGTTSFRFGVIVAGDTLPEPNETFTVTLSSQVGATILDGTAIGTIINDDPTRAPTQSVSPTLPTISISDARVNEGNSGSNHLMFTLSLSAPSTTLVTVQASVVPGTATAGLAPPYDFLPVSSPTRYAIPAGATSAQFQVYAFGDTVSEPDETLYVNLSSPKGATILDEQGTGTILNDDGGSTFPSLSISDARINEGNAGSTILMTFTLSLSAPSTTPVTVLAVPRSETATAGSSIPADFFPGPQSTMVTIPAGATSAPFNITVFGDNVSEPDETLSVILASPAGAIIFDGNGVGTIVNDDTR